MLAPLGGGLMTGGVDAGTAEESALGDVVPDMCDKGGTGEGVEEAGSGPGLAASLLDWREGCKPRALRTGDTEVGVAGEGLSTEGLGAASCPGWGPLGDVSSGANDLR